MHWSPTKTAGHKRNLDAVDLDEEGEETSEGEEGEGGRRVQGEKRGSNAPGNPTSGKTRLGAREGKPTLESEPQSGRGPTVPEGVGPSCWSLAPIAPTNLTTGPAGRTTQQRWDIELGGQHPGGGGEYSTTSSRHNSPLGKCVHLGEKHGRGRKTQR